MTMSDLSSIGHRMAMTAQKRLEALHRNGLKRCPFCGSYADTWRQSPNRGYWITGCTNAGCGVQPKALAYKRDKSIRRWNERTTE